MKKSIIVAAGIVLAGLGLMGCGGAHGNDPGDAYMPDMYYSRAYETYGYNNVGGERDSLKKRGIFYNAMPVAGTIARGDALSYHLTSDSAGMQMAQGLKNPLDSMALTKGAMKEAERLYLINCGICHGPKLDGNGPLLNSGAYVAQPASFQDPKIAGYSDGHYFHVITFGIRTMGSYASQLTPDQRWWVIKYIRSKQGAGGAAAGDSTAKATAGAATTDTTKTK